MSSPYTGHAPIHLQPYPAEFFANLAERGQRRDDAMDELMSKAASTRVQVMPGIDTDKQAAYEASIRQNLSQVADEYANGKIDYRQAHRKTLDAYNQMISDPAVIRRQQSYQNWVNGSKIRAELNSKGEYLPEINKGFEGYLEHDSEAMGEFAHSPVGPQNYDAYGNNIWDNIGSAVSTDPNEIMSQGKGLGESTLNTPAARTYEMLHPGKSWVDFVVKKGLERWNLLPKEDVDGRGRTPKGKEPTLVEQLGLAPVSGPALADDPVDERNYADYHSFKNTLRSAEEARDMAYGNIDMNGPQGKGLADSDPNRFFKKGDNYYNYANFVNRANELAATTGMTAEQAYAEAYKFNDNDQYESTAKNQLESAENNYELAIESHRQILSNARQAFGPVKWDRLVKEGVIDSSTGELNPNAKFKAEIEKEQKRLLESGKVVSYQRPGSDTYFTRKMTPEEARKDAELSIMQNNPTLKSLQKVLNDETVNYGTTNLKYYDGLALPQAEDFTKGELTANETTVRSFYESLNSSIFNGSDKTFSINSADDAAGKLEYPSFNQNNGKDFAKEVGIPEEELSKTSFVPKSVHITDGRGLVVLGTMKGSSKQIGLDLTGKEEDYAMNIFYPRGMENKEMVNLIKNKLGDDQKARDGKIKVQGTDITIQRTKDQRYRISLNNPYTKKWEQETVGSLEEAADLVNRTIGFNNDVKVGDALEQLRMTVEDPKGQLYNPTSSASGPYQIMFDDPSIQRLITGMSKQMGMAPPKTKEEFVADKELYNSVGKKLMNDAISSAYNVQKDVKDFTVGNLASLFYYLGDTGAREWIEKYKKTGDYKEADKTIPGYPKTNMSGYDYMKKSNLSI